MPFNSYKQLRRKNILMIAYNLIGFIILLVAIFDIPASSKPYIPIVLIVFIPAISISCIKKYIDRKKSSRDANIGIYIGSMIISLVVVNILGYVVLSHVDFDTVTNTKQSEAPTQKASLTFEDFGYEKNRDENLDIKFDKSILAQKTFYSCSNGDSFLSYTIFESKYPWLIKLDENRVVSRLNNNHYNYNLNLNLKLQMTDLPSNIRVYLEGGGGTKNYFVLVSEDKVIYFLKLANNISEDEFLNMAYKKLF
jgi:small basic protein